MAESMQDFSFQAALDYFKDKGAPEAGIMQRQPLQYLKAKEAHKLRILPGVLVPVEWFVACRRHYLGNPPVQVIRRAGLRFNAFICPQSVGKGPCWGCHARSYLEALSSQLSQEFFAREAAIVNAYRPNLAEPITQSYLLTKTVLDQLITKWREGYVFFHPTEGCTVELAPVANMNVFAVQLDLMKKVPVPPPIMSQAKPLSEVIDILMIDSKIIKNWFIEAFVQNVDHFIQTGEARPIDLTKLLTPLSTAPPPSTGEVSAAPSVAVGEPTDMGMHTPLPTPVDQPLPTPPPAAAAGQPSFLSDLKDRVAKLGS